MTKKAKLHTYRLVIGIYHFYIILYLCKCYVIITVVLFELNV